MTHNKRNNKIIPINNPVLIIPQKKIILLPIKSALEVAELPSLNSSKNKKLLSKMKLQPKFHTTSPKANKSKLFNKSYSTSPKATKSKLFNKSSSTSPKSSRKISILNIKQKSESIFLKRTNVLSFEQNWHKLSYKQIDTIKTLLAPYYSTCDLDLMILGLEKQKL